MESAIVVQNICPTLYYKLHFFTKIFYGLKRDGYILQTSLRVLESFRATTQLFNVLEFPIHLLGKIYRMSSLGYLLGLLVFITTKSIQGSCQDFLK